MQAMETSKATVNSDPFPPQGVRMGKCFWEGVHAGLICTMGGIWEDALLHAGCPCRCRAPTLADQLGKLSAAWTERG